MQCDWHRKCQKVGTRPRHETAAKSLTWSDDRGPVVLLGDKPSHSAQPLEYKSLVRPHVPPAGKQGIR